MKNTIQLIFASIYLLLSSLMQAEEKPNILWLTLEDIGPHFGCYDYPAAKTPAIDSVAKKGMRYDVAWSNQPVCAAARSSLIMGMMACAVGGEHMRSEVPLPKGLRMYPNYLRDLGYVCINQGKEDYNYIKNEVVWDQVKFEKRPQDKPFFCIFNQTMTHESKIRSKGHQLITDPATVRVPSHHPDIPEVRRDWAQYMDNINRADKWVAGHLKALEDAGASDNTIVFIYGDHGSGMPRHKRFPGDSGLRVPMVVYVPDGLKELAPSDYQAGGVSKRMVTFIDLAPTAISLAGGEPPKHMHGLAFMGEHQTPAPPYIYGGRARMDERPDLIRTLRDEQFLYMRNYMPHRPHGQHVNYQFQTIATHTWKRLYDEGKLTSEQARFWQTKDTEELYDLKADPDEVNNLAANPKYAEVLERFRKEHKRHTLEIRDISFLTEQQLNELTVPPYTHAQDEAAYPLEKIFDMAQIATRRADADIPALIKGLKDKDATVRYWAATGFLVRGEKAVNEHLDILKACYDDDLGGVRVTAAEAIAANGPESECAAALDVLLKISDRKTFGPHDAVLALNSIGALGEKAQPIHAAAKALPKTPGSEKEKGKKKVKIKRSHKYDDRLIGDL